MEKIKDLLQKEYDERIEGYNNPNKSWDFRDIQKTYALRIQKILSNRPIFNYINLNELNNFDTEKYTILNITPTVEYHASSHSNAYGYYYKNIGHAEAGYSQQQNSHQDANNFALIEYQYNLDREIERCFAEDEIFYNYLHN